MGGEKSRRHLPLRAAKSPNDIADRISHRLKLLALNCSHSCRACRGCDDRASGRSPASTDVRNAFILCFGLAPLLPLLPCRQPTGLSTPSLLRERPALSDQRPLTPPTPVTRRTRTSAGDPNPTSTLVTSHGGWSPAIVTGPTRGIHGIGSLSLHCSLASTHWLSRPALRRPHAFQDALRHNLRHAANPRRRLCPRRARPTEKRHVRHWAGIHRRRHRLHPLVCAPSCRYLLKGCHIQMGVGLQWDSVSRRNSGSRSIGCDTKVVFY